MQIAKLVGCLMPWTSAHIQWLSKTEVVLRSADGLGIEVWELCHQPDETVLSAWAKHFRNHYCRDAEIDCLRAGYGCSRSEYLTRIKFPDSHDGFGPSVRAGDFGEILVADYLQYLLGYWVPRTRYGDKSTRNESTKGCDTIAFKIVGQSPGSPRDELAVYETKAKFRASSSTSNRLQDAIDGSGKDNARLGDSLNAIRQRLLWRGEDSEEAAIVERFQNLEDRPYRERYGAAAVLDTALTYSEAVLCLVNAAGHPNRESLSLVVIRGNEMMELVTELYRRAADEA